MMARPESPNFHQSYRDLECAVSDVTQAMKVLEVIAEATFDAPDPELAKHIRTASGLGSYDITVMTKDQADAFAYIKSHLGDVIRRLDAAYYAPFKQPEASCA